MSNSGLGKEMAAGLTDQDKAALHESIAQNVRLALAGDWRAAAELFTDDVVLMPPDSPPVIGRARLTEMFAGVTITAFFSKLLESDGCGDVAYGRGEHSWTMVVEGNTQPVVENGKWMAVWRKQKDGRWLIAVDMWSSTDAAGE